MHISPQSDVVGKIPTIVIWICIDYDVVGVPEPVIDEVIIIGSNLEEETVKSKPLSVSAMQPEDMKRTNCTRKASMFPRMIETIVGIVPACIVAKPLYCQLEPGTARLTA